MSILSSMVTFLSQLAATSLEYPNSHLTVLDVDKSSTLTTFENSDTVELIGQSCGLSRVRSRLWARKWCSPTAASLRPMQPRTPTSGCKTGIIPVPVKTNKTGACLHLGAPDQATAIRSSPPLPGYPGYPGTRVPPGNCPTASDTNS
eukprot:1076081-Rhodomonas_salina.1